VSNCEAREFDPESRRMVPVCDAEAPHEVTRTMTGIVQLLCTSHRDTTFNKAHMTQRSLAASPLWKRIAEGFERARTDDVSPPAPSATEAPQMRLMGD